MTHGVDRRERYARRRRRNRVLTAVGYARGMSVVSTSEQIERRRSARSRIGHYVLRIDLGDDRDLISCVVWDMSEVGARLLLPADIELPGEVNVVIGNVTHRARVVWSKNRQVGLEFLDQLSDL